MKLWWVHNEALIATLYAWRLSGEIIMKALKSDKSDRQIIQKVFKPKLITAESVS